MTKTDNSASSAKGHVSAFFVRNDGYTECIADKDNMTMYAAADAMAAAYAGDSSLVPKHVAFLYGDDDTPADSFIDKSTKWADIANSFEHSVTGFSYAPTLTSTGDEYARNAVVFHCRTENIPDNKKVYKACLLGKSVYGSEYSLLAVVDLGTDGAYKSKPEDFELSIDWTVKFR